MAAWLGFATAWLRCVTAWLGELVQTFRFILGTPAAGRVSTSGWWTASPPGRAPRPLPLQTLSHCPGIPSRVPRFSAQTRAALSAPGAGARPACGVPWVLKL